MDTILIVLLVAMTYVYFRSRHRTPAGEPVRAEPRRPAAEGPEGAGPEDFIAAIPGYAAKHIEIAENNFGVRLDYDEESFAQLDQIIEEGWGGQAPMLPGTTAIMFGSFVGESLRRLLGGHWEFGEAEGFFLADIGEADMRVFPFEKVEKRFVNGEADSLASYYAAIKHAVAQRRAEAPTA